MFSGESNKRYPFSVTIEATNRCLLKCKHCFNEKIIKQDINYNDLKNFLSYCKGHTKQIILTGGEPLISKCFSQIIYDFSDNYSIDVVTSGYMDYICFS